MSARPVTPSIDQGPEAVASRVLDGFEQAWNRGDGPAFAAPFADDSDFVDVRGDHHRGRAEVAAGHEGIFATIYSGSTVRYELESARSVRPGVVVAVAAATLEVPAGPVAGTLLARLTVVLVADDDRWTVASFHNTPRQPTG